MGFSLKFLVIIVLCAPLLFSPFLLAHERPSQRSAVQHEKVTYPSIVKIHPPAVHFGIAIPVATLVLHAFYHLRRREPDGVEFLMVFLSALSTAGAALSGYIAHESIEDLPISAEALELLHTHETLGIAVALLFGVVLGLRVLYHFKRISVLHHLYAFLLLVGIFLIFYQGNLGGRLVYDHGIGINM